jgi:hypothetical protein
VQGVDEMVKTLQGHFQEGRFISPQTATIPEYVEVFIVVTGKPIARGDVGDNISYKSRITERDSRLLRKPDSLKPSLLGCMEGLVKIPNDFDEPLEEMQEYMF